jgi:hypothetical protein
MNPDSSNEQNSQQNSQRMNQRSPYLFFLPNFFYVSDRNNNSNNSNNDDRIDNSRVTHQDQERILPTSSSTSTSPNGINESIPVIPSRIYDTQESNSQQQQQQQQQQTLRRRVSISNRNENDIENGIENTNENDNENGNGNGNDHRNERRNADYEYSRTPRRLSSFDRNSSYGILNSATSLFSIDDLLDDPFGSSEGESSDGSTQNLLALLDRIHRINILSRAIEEERRRQRELELERERQRQREMMLNSEQNELNNFVNLFNTMLFLVSAERQLNRPFQRNYSNNISSHEEELNERNSMDEGGTGEGNESSRGRESMSIPRQPQPQPAQQQEIRYIYPNPNPIITTPFMYARFEPERERSSMTTDENRNETTTTDTTNVYAAAADATEETNNPFISNTSRVTRPPFITRYPGNYMYVNFPLAYDIANLIQILSLSNAHRHLGASKEAMETSTRIITPEMMKFGTRLQTQPNCIICQDDFLTNVNKRLRSKASSLKTEINLVKDDDNDDDDVKEKDEDKKEKKKEEGHKNENENENEKEKGNKKVNQSKQEGQENEGKDKEINTEDDNIRLMPCGHIFHESCIFQWLKENNTCPVCRYELETDDEEYNEGVHKRMAERGIDIPSFNIDFTFFCSLEKSGQCKFIIPSNRLTKRQGDRGHSLLKCNSIENLVSHAITQSNTMNMRYIRLPCCNHEFHWPCLKEALIKAGYHWKDENENSQDPFFIPKKNEYHHQIKSKLNTTTNPLNINSDSKININTKSNNNNNNNNNNNSNNNNNNTDLEGGGEGGEGETIDYSIQSSSHESTSTTTSTKKPKTEDGKEDDWIEIKCPVCKKVNRLPVEALKSKEPTKPSTMSRSISLTTLPKSLSIEKLELRKLTTYNSLMNLNLYN